jgi:proline racemase
MISAEVSTVDYHAGGEPFRIVTDVPEIPGATVAAKPRNVAMFADGEVDRSPCGSGTCSRVATLHATGQLKPHQVLFHSSISGSEWKARVTDTLQAADREAIIPVVTGRAFRTGEHRFVVDPDDDMAPGFVLR